MLSFFVKITLTKFKFVHLFVTQFFWITNPFRHLKVLPKSMSVLVNLTIQITLCLIFQFHLNDWMIYPALFKLILSGRLFLIDACSRNLWLHSFHVLLIFHNFNEVFYFHFLYLYLPFHILTSFCDLHLYLFLLFVNDLLPIFNFLLPVLNSTQVKKFIKSMILTLLLMMFQFLDTFNRLKLNNL